jgi:sec-independent protein translocase protein TatB
VFGISAPEFIVLLAVAAVVLGPERMPQYAAQLGRLVRELRRMAQGASVQVRNEMGPEFDEIDWRKFDPRQYDPRRIVRDALSDSFDPDDPLGLRDLRDDEKPVSNGGPATRSQDVGTDGDLAPVDGAGNGNGNGSGRPERTRDPAAPPPFDADAT